MTRLQRMSLLGLAAVGSLMANVAMAASSLQDLNFTALGGDRMELKLDFVGGVPEVKGYRIETPPRITIDLLDTSSQLDKRRFDLGLSGVDELVALEAGSRTRLVMKLNQSKPYVTRTEGNSLYVIIGEQGGAPGAQPAAASQASAANVPPDNRALEVASEPAVSGIDFRRGTDGEGRVVINFNRSNVESRVTERGRKIYVDIKGVKLPPEMNQVLDVGDFATPVTRIDPQRTRDGVRMVVDASGYYTQLATQAGNELVLEVKPLTREEQAERIKDKFPYTGKKISLNFQNIEVRSVLQIIADFTGLNLVASDNVTGNVTLNLKEVPWDQALDLVLKSNGLASRRMGNVLMVAPAEELAALERKELEANQQVKELAPMTTEYIQMRYAKAADLAALLRGEGGIGLLSERGRVMVDERTNTMLIQDTRDTLESIRGTLEYLDIPVRQVQIEARIVIARSSVSSEIGVNWGLSNSSNGKFGLEGASTGTTSNGGLSVDLGDDSSPGSTFSFGYLSGDILLDLELSALESEGKSQTISQPKIITANQKKAVIKQGQEIPYEEATSSGATNIEFKEAVLALEVTPQITPDNRIIMDLLINNDDVSDDSFNGEPAIDTNEIETQVLVNDGETVVLGGILTSEQIRSVFKTPFLGDLPVIGNLFRYTEESNEKVELLVFITPKIIEDGLAVR